MRNFFNSIINKSSTNPIVLKGDVVDLRYLYETDENTAYDHIPTIYYDIYLHDTNQKVGSIDLRLKMDADMYYYGHIGYNVIPKYRGNHYSYEACLVLFREAKYHYGIDELYITCNPDNIASYKTLVRLNGELIETVDVPKNHELYRYGDKIKCIFRFKVSI